MCSVLEHYGGRVKDGLKRERETEIRGESEDWQ